MALVHKVAVATACGCDARTVGGPSIETAGLLTLTEPKSARKHLPYFGYAGSDDDYHDFRADNLRHYRLVAPRFAEDGIHAPVL